MNAPVSATSKQRQKEMFQEELRGLAISNGQFVIDDELVAFDEMVNLAGEKTAAEHRQNGNDALKLGQVDNAIQSYKSAILLAPEQAENYELLGVALSLDEHAVSGLAEAAFRTATKYDPDLASAHMKLAGELSNSGTRMEAAIASYERAVELDPELGQAYARLAVLSYYLDRDDDAKKYIKLAELNGAVVPPQLKFLLDKPIDTSRRQRGISKQPIIEPAVRVDVTNPTFANETSSVAIGDLVIAGWNDYRGPSVASARVGVGISTDKGDTWSDSLLDLPPEITLLAGFDPFTCVDKKSGDIWIGGTSFSDTEPGVAGLYVARMDDGTTQFYNSVAAIVGGTNDKPLMACGVDPRDKNKTRLYIACFRGLVISEDDGDSWSQLMALPLGNPIQFPRGYQPHVDNNGDLFITYFDSIGDKHYIIRSFDGGLSFGNPILVATPLDATGFFGTRLPGNFAVTPFVQSALDPNDSTLYAVFSDVTDQDPVSGNFNVDVYICRSDDLGLTWTTPTVLNSDSTPPADQFLPWIEVDCSGRVHVVFYDTRSQPQNDSDGSGPPAIAECYYAYSDDRGDTWTEMVISPQPFTVPDDDGGTRIGHYIGMAVNGRTVHPCYMSTHEGAAHIYSHRINPCLLGDVNGDGSVDLDDVDPFVDLLTSGGYSCESDINGDCVLDLSDVDPFLDLISG